MEYILIEAPPDWANYPDTSNTVNEIRRLADSCDYLRTELRKKHELRLKKTDKQKTEDRRIYRKEYQTRPLTIEKNAKRREDPLVKEKKKNYASKTEVKERKKELNKRQRKIKRLLQQERPDIYNDLIRKLEEDNNGYNSNGCSTCGDFTEPHQ